MNDETVKTIELDCDPFSPSPSSYIGGVIAGLSLQEKDPCSTFFGNFVWNYSEVSDERWIEIKPILKERIESLYNNGLIRFGSW